jgi:hypothetical protein
MGLTASHTNVSQHVDLATATNSNTSLKPNLICEPGGTCGTPQYFENTKTVDGYTGYNQVEYVGSRTAAGVVGCVAGDAVLGISYVLDPGEAVSFVTGPVLWQAACDAGAAIAGAIESWLVIPPQMRANSPAMVEG